MGIVTVLPTVRSQSLALKRKFNTQAQRPRAGSGLHPALMRLTQEDRYHERGRRLSSFNISPLLSSTDYPCASVHAEYIHSIQLVPIRGIIPFLLFPLGVSS